MANEERESSRAEAETELKVTDRRLFTSDGQLRGDVAVDEEERVVDPEPEKAQRNETEPRQEAFERQSVEEPEGVDFTMLINAMAEPALLFLGEIAHPGTGQPTVDLERARIQIDMLDLLRVKCRGNLNTEEDGLLDRILYQLRMLYVNRQSRPQG
jgi:hypothetical protein